MGSKEEEGTNSVKKEKMKLSFVAILVALIAMIQANRIENLRSSISASLEKKTSASECAQDVTVCPTYPPNQTGKCDNSKSGIVNNCVEIAEAILSGTSYSANTIAAANIGCAYAKNYWQGNPNNLLGNDCAQQCSFTVWTFQGGNSNCNYNNGLGISVPQLNNFGAGKACRIGCVIGNRDIKA